MPILGEIRMFGGSYPPSGWAFCEGQELPISENESLFQLIGTTYGGDGQETFGLPDLRGRVPIHMGTGPDGVTRNFGESGGAEEVTLATSQIPAHDHGILGSMPVYGSNPGSTADPRGAYPAMSPGNKLYSIVRKADELMTPPVDSSNTENPKFSIESTGGSQPHNNMQPYLCVSFIISLFGAFPSQT